MRHRHFTLCGKSTIHVLALSVTRLEHRKIEHYKAPLPLNKNPSNLAKQDGYIREHAQIFNYTLRSLGNYSYMVMEERRLIKKPLTMDSPSDGAPTKLLIESPRNISLWPRKNHDKHISEGFSIYQNLWRWNGRK